MDNPIKEVLKENGASLNDSEMFASLLAKRMPGQNLEQFLIVLALEAGIPDELRYDWKRNKKKYASKISEQSGCTDEMALKIIELWMDAIPYEEPEMGNLQPPIIDGCDGDEFSWEKLPWDDAESGKDEEYPGKTKCNTLKAIRRKIAEANDISYHTEECSYHGPCPGTCPKCDAEIRYLNEELQKKEARGEEISLADLGEEEIANYMEALSNDPIEEISCGNLTLGESEPLWETPAVDMNIDELELSVRAYNCLKRAGIYTVADLTNRSAEEMMKVRNLGRKSLDEVLAKLKELGLHLRESDD